jgi:hypothetical protein
MSPVPKNSSKSFPWNFGIPPLEPLSETLPSQPKNTRCINPADFLRIVGYKVQELNTNQLSAELNGQQIFRIERRHPNAEWRVCQGTTIIGDNLDLVRLFLPKAGIATAHFGLSGWLTLAQRAQIKPIGILPAPQIAGASQTPLSRDPDAPK